MGFYRFFALCMAVFVVFPFSLYAGGKSEKRRTPTPAPAPVPVQVPETPPAPEKSGVLLAGTNEGLFDLGMNAAGAAAGRATALWSGGSVRKILALGDNAGWAIMGSGGILVSDDLRTWEERNHGLPVKTIKVFEHKQKSFLQIVQEVKDLAAAPTDANIMACATKDRVYLSRDQGRSWTSLAALPYRTNGIKAVAVAYMPRAGGDAAADLTVFLSHSVYGIHFYQPDRPNPQWIELNNGIEKLETTNNPDEVADIAFRETAHGPVMYVSQTFRRRIYQLDWNQRTFNLIWSDDSPFGTVDSLYPGTDKLFFLHEGTVASLNYADFKMQKQPDIVQSIRAASIRGTVHCVVLRDTIILSELWLLNEPRDNTAHIADNKEGIFVPLNQAIDSNRFKNHLDTIERTGMNMIVIDMKDELGRLRFTPHNPAISAMGRVFSPLDIDTFLPEMKRRGIFTVARVVVFKDQELAVRENGKYAVWDGKNAKPWIGYNDVRRRTSSITAEERNNRSITFFPTNDPEFEIVRTAINERWVDPYSEEVWEYIAAISQELYERGIDEIQYDYIRFPTDGDNLGDARYRWRDSGMDSESAILSFLRHARSRVNAPISIDIYGANGWYRTGARTGQEVELLAPWVDVICPMYYPSHFEQHFLAQRPAELRPWRIYFHGTLRTDRIARGQVIIRPWTQAFFLNVSYDRQYYGGPLGTAEDYVRRQIEATRLAGTGGFTHWNNIGRYDDLPDK
ncbi:MAG: hypothetical protein FWD36_00375 [Treponema sp.]|nr:hypothetical protein [Treponema sp.]